jgi:hypothetical protein
MDVVSSPKGGAMATHGTILVTSKVEGGRILLQTPSDGHTEDALKMLKNLPKWMAKQKKWRARVLANSTGPVTLEQVQGWERRHATCELCLVEMANWIVAMTPCRWRIIPPQFQKGYLADYDRNDEHHIKVRILEGSEYRVTPPASDEELASGDKRFQSFEVDMLSIIHPIHLKMANDLVKKGK